MSKEINTADIDADGKDDILGQTPAELQKADKREGGQMSLLESLGRRDMEGMTELNLQELLALLEQVQQLKHLRGAPEFIRLIEIALSERRAAGDLPVVEKFEYAPGEYTERTDGDASTEGEVGGANETAMEVEQEVPTKSIPHLPVIVGGVIFLTVLGGVLFMENKASHVAPVEATKMPILVNGQSLAEFKVEYAKAGIYAAYTPEQYITYSAGTNAPAESVSWLVCDSTGSFVKAVPLAMLENTDDQALKPRRWKSSGAAALPPGNYQVTVRAESEAGETALQSFLFDPIHGVNSSTPSPECKASPAGI